MRKYGSDGHKHLTQTFKQLAQMPYLTVAMTMVLFGRKLLPTELMVIELISGQPVAYITTH